MRIINWDNLIVAKSIIIDTIFINVGVIIKSSYIIAIGYIPANGSSSKIKFGFEAIHLANEKIKKRIRRYHRRLTDHRSSNLKSLKYIEANEYIIKDPEKIKKSEISNEPIIIAESEELIKTISVGEALMLMKLNDQNAIFFKNIQTKRLNLLFKRSDGNIGWLDPKK